MTPAQRRAHLILHGQTLLDAWQARAKLYAEGDKLYAEGDKLYAKGSKLWAEGDKLYAEGDKLRAEGHKLWAKGSKLYAEGDKLRAEGHKLWREAVATEFGPDCAITWDGDTCILGCGEIYTTTTLP